MADFEGLIFYTWQLRMDFCDTIFKVYLYASY